MFLVNAVRWNKPNRGFQMIGVYFFYLLADTSSVCMCSCVQLASQRLPIALRRFQLATF